MSILMRKNFRFFYKDETLRGALRTCSEWQKRALFSPSTAVKVKNDEISRVRNGKKLFFYHSE